MDADGCKGRAGSGICSMTTAADTCDCSNVLAFDTARRGTQIADENVARAAIDAFLSTAGKHGCRWASMTGYTPDGRMFKVHSHDICDGTAGVEVSIETQDEARRRIKKRTL